MFVNQSSVLVHIVVGVPSGCKVEVVANRLPIYEPLLFKGFRLGIILISNHQILQQIRPSVFLGCSRAPVREQSIINALDSSTILFKFSLAVVVWTGAIFSSPSISRFFQYQLQHVRKISVSCLEHSKSFDWLFGNFISMTKNFVTMLMIVSATTAATLWGTAG